MTESSSRLLRATLFAMAVAAGFGAIKLVAIDVCGNPLECFAPGQEGEMWQALEPFGQTNDQLTCTNSTHPDSGRQPYLSRQCQYNDANGAPFPVLMPPKLGQMLDPFMLAVDGERIYVSDQSNHRVQVFKFDGTPIPLAHPIGDGVPGGESYGPYPADSRLTGHDLPISGVRLFSPDGLAVDADHKLVVADAAGRVTVFNPDGSPAFGTIESPGRVQLPQHFSYGAQATGVAMTPGTVIRGISGGEVPADDNSRIVVTDLMSSFVFIYNSDFKLLKQIPEQVPEGAEPNSACMWGEDAPLGTFCTPVAAAIDSAGRIYISEYDNNRIQVLDLNGNPIGYFGSQDLQYPWGITFDHLGRLGVADTENQRLAFFTVTFPSGQPVSTFLFELDAAGTLNGYPTGIVEQAGTGSGLDPAGRFLVTDTLNNRVQRFQLPDLAVINPQIDFANGTGTFQVAVPAAKAATVTKVGVSAMGANASVLTLNGVAPANTSPLDPLHTAEENATAALGTDIAPGQIASYQFTFSAVSQSAMSFVFRAVGNGGVTGAEPAELNAAAPCLTCESTHTIFEKPAIGPPTVGATPNAGWYNKQLTVRVNATTTHELGLSAIAFQFVSGPESAGVRWGGAVYQRPASGASASTDFTVISEGVSTFRYWAIGADGTVESSHFVTLSLDLTAPNVSFTLTPEANAAGWNNTTVDGTFRHTDVKSGPVFTGIGTFSFPNEGRNQYVEQAAADRAGNVLAPPARSNQTGLGGRTVNIDMTAPDFVTLPANIQIVATGSNFGVISPTAGFVATATDPPLNDLRPGATDLAGSGSVVIGNPGAHQFPMGSSNWPFTATDAAGNVRTANRTVTVVKATGTIDYTGPLTVQYGDPLHMTATVGPAFATGDVTFTLATDAGITVTLSGTTASATIGQVLKNVGNYTLTVSYSGSLSVTAASTQVQIAVTPGTVNMPPVCTAAFGGEIWPPNHKKFYAAPIHGVVDPEGGAITLLVTGIEQDEPIDSTGDGKFSPDGQGVGTSTAWLRAERNGHGNKAKGNGRVYVITYRATDNQNASCTGSVTYTVPHDQGQGSTAIDDGVRYDSTGAVPGARNKSQTHKNSTQP